MADYFSSLPPELALEAERIQRRRALSDRLLQQSLAPIQQQMVGGRVVPISPLEGIGRMASAYFGRQGQENADKAQMELAGKYNTGLSDAVRTYMQRRQGAPASSEQIIDEQAAGGEGAPATINAPAVPGSPMEAIIGGMTSGYRPVQQLAAKELETIGKNALTPKDLLTLNDFDPKTRVVAVQMLAAGRTMPEVMSALAPKKELKTVGADQQLLDVTGDSPKTVRGYDNQFEKNPDGSTKVYTIAGDRYQRNERTGEYKKMDNAPKISVDARTSVSVAGPKKGAEVLFIEGGKTLSELGERARAAQDVANRMKQLQELDARGIYSNVTTGAATFAANLAEAVGVPISERSRAKLGNTETYNAVVTEAWQKLVNQFGGNRGVTKEEAEQIKQILPLTKNSPEARAQLYNILGSAAQRTQAQFREANAAYTKAVTTDDPSQWTQWFERTFAPNPPTDLSTGPKPIGNLRPYQGGQP